MHADRRKPDDWKLFADDVRETLRFLDKLNIRIVPAEATRTILEDIHASRLSGWADADLWPDALDASPYNPQRSADMSETWENPTIDLARLRTEHAFMEAMLERIALGYGDYKDRTNSLHLIRVAALVASDFRTMKAKRQQEEG